MWRPSCPFNTIHFPKAALSGMCSSKPELDCTYTRGSSPLPHSARQGTLQTMVRDERREACCTSIALARRSRRVLRALQQPGPGALPSTSCRVSVKRQARNYPDVMSVLPCEYVRPRVQTPITLVALQDTPTRDSTPDEAVPLTQTWVIESTFHG
jgi:hypothetical protein